MFFSSIYTVGYPRLGDNHTRYDADDEQRHYSRLVYLVILPHIMFVF
jgi:hypothetical protein